MTRMRSSIVFGLLSPGLVAKHSRRTSGTSVNWTSTTPTDVGWYWFKAHGVDPCVIGIERQDGRLKVIIPIGRIVESYFFDEILPFTNMQWSDAPVPLPE